MNMKHQHQLAELIDETRKVNGWSDQDIVNRAEAAGHKISKANISRVRRSPVVAVNIGFVNALAAGTGLLPITIARAALDAAGIATGAGQVSIEQAIDTDTKLSLDNKQTLRLMVAAMKGNGNGND